MSCSCSAAVAPVARSRADVVVQAATALADVGGLPPGLVALVADDDGLLVVARDADFGSGPFDVEAACARLLHLSPPNGSAAAVVVSIDPGFGLGDPAVGRAWRALQQRFAGSGAVLVDWLLRSGSTTTSVGSAHEETVP